MGTTSSICGSDSETVDYSPAYLGQIYAGVILNSARTTSTGYASTLSLNSLYASTLSLNSLCDRRRNSLAPNGKVLSDKRNIPLIDEGDEYDPDLLHPNQHPPLAEPESLLSVATSNSSSGSSVNIDQKNENKRVIEEIEKDMANVDKESKNVLNLLKSLPFCGKIDIIE